MRSNGGYVITLFKLERHRQQIVIAVITSSGRQSAHRLLLAISFLLAAVALTGCGFPPQTLTSLSDSHETPYDEKLIGFWQMDVLAQDQDERGAFYLQVWPDEGHGLVVLGLSASATAEGEPEWLLAHAHVSPVNDQFYYNLQLISGNTYYYCTVVDCRGPVMLERDVELAKDEDSKDKEQESRFVLLRAEITDQDQLYLYFMNPHVILDLVVKGRVKVREISGCDGFCGYDVLDLSKDELIGLLQTVGPDQLFYSKGIGPFHRTGTETQWVSDEELRAAWSRSNHDNDLN